LELQCIGIALNISKLSNGLLYGLLAGSVVFVVLFLPAYQFILAPEITPTMAEVKETTTSQSKQYPTTTITTTTAPQYQYANNIIVVMIVWLLIHLVFGTALGGVSSSLSIWFGSRYRCAKNVIFLFLE
jgi:NADH:quinone reductase (non-electrogenic)